MTYNHNNKQTILIVDDEEKALKVLKINLKDKYNVLLARNGNQALSLINHEPVDLVLTDLKMPEMSGNELVKQLREQGFKIPVIIMTAYGTVENAVESIKQGAFDYVLKPLNLDNLKITIEKALSYNKILEENLRLKEQIKTFEGFRQIITINPEMKKLLDMVRQVATTRVPVLIEGESGTGKELFARAIHYLSDRADKPMISINCGAIPSELMESELFGHEKGAFTGANTTKKGKFELADKGTLFLDEIGELPLNLQVKLLRAIEEQQFTRVGGTQLITTDIRFIAATNRDLEKEVEEGRFRQDLYYRLRVVKLHIPPLRERKDDIPVLVQHFINKHSKDVGKKIKNFTEEFITLLNRYDWPGNVRELENIVLHAMIFSQGDTLTPSSLPKEFLEKIDLSADYANLTTKEQLQKAKKKRYEAIDRELEYKFLDNILTQTRGNISKAAEISGYDRRQLQNLIKKNNINPDNYK